MPVNISWLIIQASNLNLSHALTSSESSTPTLETERALGLLSLSLFGLVYLQPDLSAWRFQPLV